jgi:hypothetical protein
VWHDTFSQAKGEGEAKSLYQFFVDLLDKLKRAFTREGFIEGVKDMEASKKAITQAFQAWSDRTQVQRGVQEQQEADAKAKRAQEIQAKTEQAVAAAPTHPEFGERIKAVADGFTAIGDAEMAQVILNGLGRDMANGRAIPEQHIAFLEDKLRVARAKKENAGKPVEPRLLDEAKLLEEEPGAAPLPKAIIKAAVDAYNKHATELAKLGLHVEEGKASNATAEQKRLAKAAHDSIIYLETLAKRRKGNNAKTLEQSERDVSEFTGIDTKQYPGLVEAQTPGGENAESPMLMTEGLTSGPQSPEYEASRKALFNGKGKRKTVTLKDGSKAIIALAVDDRFADDPKDATYAAVAFTEDGKPIAEMGYSKDGENHPDIFVDDVWQRKGLASAMYDFAVEDGGIVDFGNTNNVQTTKGRAFRTAYDAKRGIHREEAKEPIDKPAGTPDTEADEALAPHAIRKEMASRQEQIQALDKQIKARKGDKFAKPGTKKHKEYGALVEERGKLAEELAALQVQTEEHADEEGAWNPPMDLFKAPDGEKPAAKKKRLKAAHAWLAKAKAEAFAEEDDDALWELQFRSLFLDPVATTRTEERAKGKPVLTQEQADDKLRRWKAAAIREGETSKNGGIKVLSLFDHSGVWSQPWVEAGYQVQRVDIKNGDNVMDIGPEWLSDRDIDVDVDIVLAAVPCTDFSSAGAWKWPEKDVNGNTEASIQLAKQTKAILEYLRPAVWAIENPVGRIQRLADLPDPSLIFDPHHFGDPYTKHTLLYGSLTTLATRTPSTRCFTGT